MDSRMQIIKIETKKAGNSKMLSQNKSYVEKRQIEIVEKISNSLIEKLFKTLIK